MRIAAFSLSCCCLHDRQGQEVKKDSAVIAKKIPYYEMTALNSLAEKSDHIESYAKRLIAQALFYAAICQARSGVQ